MTRKAGERLFEAIGQIPEKMILEAEQDGLTQMQEPEGDLLPADGQQEDGHTALEGTEAVQKKQLRLKKRKERMKKAGGYLKYIPVAACLCIVFIGAYYVVGSYKNMDKDGFFMSENGAGSSQGYDDVADTAGGIEDAQVTENDVADQSEEAADDGGEESSKENGSYALPVRYDAYEGPVIAMTATGDTQKLKTSRKLEQTVTAEQYEGVTQPLLQVTDTYRIKNTSDEDKTLQLVYPFVTTLNLAYETGEDLLKVEGQDDLNVTYGIGDSVSASIYGDPAVTSTAEDYEQLLNKDKEEDYKEHALRKEADWDKEVSVYTFSDISVQEDGTFRGRTGVVGVTVYGTDADVLTYGFDYSAEREEGRTDHCFFAAQKEQQIYLIVTGELSSGPQLDYYSNLDCTDKIEGIQCTVEEQKMSYSDALRLCSTAAVRQMAQDYDQGVYAGRLPEYLDADTAYQALTVISEEEGFFDTLVQRYQSTELKEIYEKLLGETRIVYAMATVTIPAGQSVRAAATTQKRQSRGYYTLAVAKDADTDHRFEIDGTSGVQSHLNITKTAFRLTLPDGWQITDSSMELELKKDVWKADLKAEAYYVTLHEK